MGEWSDVYGSKATRKKVYLGRGIKYFEKAGTGEFLMECNFLTPGDEILITGPTTGVVYAKADELRVNDQQKNKVVKGDQFTLPLEQKIRTSDKLFKLVNC